MKRISVSPPVAAIFMAVILFLLSGLLPNGFGSDQEVPQAKATNSLRLAVFLGVIAVLQTLVVIAASEGIDLRAGSVVTVPAILTYVLVTDANAKVFPASLISLAVGAVITSPYALAITLLKLSPFLIALGMSATVT